MTKLKYIIDQDYDAYKIFEMLMEQNENIVKYQSEWMEIDFKLALRVSKAKDYNQIQKEIQPIVDQRYKALLTYMKKSLVCYQQSWDEINEQFFQRLAKLTSFPIQFNIFYCVVSAFNPGISNWGGNKIVRRWNYNLYTQRRITAHEIIISHFFSFMRKTYPNKLTDQQIWQLAEICAFIFTGLDPVMKKFWPWDNYGAYIDHNYSHIVSLQKKLTKVYHDKGFKIFLETGIQSFC